MNKKLKIKQEKGITLIALVVTIVVLLILAGISISMLTGEKGVITQAREAKEKTEIGYEKEQVNLAYSSAKSKKIENGDNTPVNADDINEELNLQKADAIASGENPIIVKFKKSKREYEINENGRILEAKKSNLIVTMKIEGEKLTDPIIPYGFEHVEGTTVNTGYVIKNTIDGNEFVWVPVEKNQRIILNIISKKDIKEIKLYDPYGDKILTLIDPETKTIYDNHNIIPTINGRYLLEIITEDGIETRTLRVNSLYAKNYNNREWTTFEEAAKLHGISKQELLQNVATELFGTNLDEVFEELNISSIEEFEQWLIRETKKEFKDLVDYTENVNEYGGFYIARYEAGTKDARTNGSREDSVDYIIKNSGIPVSKEGYVPYNWVTEDQARKLTENMYSNSKYSNFEVSLITGSGWDRTLGWINETGNKNAEELNESSVNWGNYKEAEFEINKGMFSEDFGKTYIKVEDTYKKNKGKGVYLTTGATERNSANNIFDLAGNVEEITNEGWHMVEDTSTRVYYVVHRGYNLFNESDSLYNRSAGTDCIASLGFRAALYIKAPMPIKPEDPGQLKK